jgi:hypothetical protein
MKNSDYQIIVKNLTNQINQCESALIQYNLCSQDVSKMVIEQINSTISSCREAQGEMDKFVKSDLYHLIGMADLSAAQTAKIIKLTKTLLKYRSDIKFFASQNKIQVPQKKTSSYKLSSGIKLLNEKGG